VPRLEQAIRRRALPLIAGDGHEAAAMTDTPKRPEPEMTTAAGPWGGPVYSYRGAEIRCARGGHVCSLFMEGHPLHGSSFGVVGTITPLVDLWVEERRLPSYMRAVPKAGDT
jgi:hypothetical protein